MLDEEEYRQAAKTAMEWDEWVGAGSVPTGDAVDRDQDAEDSGELRELKEKADELF
jgi:hypothetical protein